MNTGVRNQSGHRSVSVFGDAYAEINKARRDFLANFLPGLIESSSLNNALDVGCGYGFFSRYLRSLDLKVTAIDVRPENITEASKINRNIEFRVYDIENTTVLSLGNFDLVLCFGILYHLENPFRAMRNLFFLTKKVLLVETMTAPFISQIAVLCEEEKSSDQSLHYMALIPSESCFVKMLYKVGFTRVYKVLHLPEHKDFRYSLLTKRRRTVLLASKEEIGISGLQFVQEPKKTNRYIWYRGGLSTLLENEYLREVLTKFRKILRI